MQAARTMGVDPRRLDLRTAVVTEQVAAVQRPDRAVSHDEAADDRAVAGRVGRDDLREDDLSAIEALRTSMEKAALVLRSVAALCVEKRVLSRDDMKKS